MKTIIRSIRPIIIIAIALFLAATIGCIEKRELKPKNDYIALHQKAIVADLHSDTPLRMVNGFDISQRDSSGHMDIVRLQEGGVDLQVLACFLSTNTNPDSCRIVVDELIDTIEAQLSRHPDKIEICRTAADANRIIGSGRIAAFIGIENGVAIENDLDNIGHFYDRGVRYMTLTHTSSSDWCISSADTMPAFDGLTDFGREVVAKMNQLGMIVDISHASVAAVDAVLQVTTDPVIASHSCVYSICSSNRNLTDDQIRKIAGNNGVIAINFYSGYLSNDWTRISDSIWAAHRSEVDSIRKIYPDDRSKRRDALSYIFDELNAALEQLNVNVATVVDHIDHIVNLVGSEHVGLGSDFDGVYGLPIGLKDCSMVPNITKELLARGYGQHDIENILGDNFMRLFEKVCDN